MKVSRVSLTLGVAALASLALASSSSAAVRHGAAPAPNHKIGHSTSSNWAGYAVTGGRYTSVSAAWTQPSVNCSVTPSGWSSFWVGLDGDTSNTVERAGTEADCSNGHPVYSSWYEMYPKFAKNYANRVAAGSAPSADDLNRTARFTRCERAGASRPVGALPGGAGSGARQLQGELAHDGDDEGARGGAADGGGEDGHGR